jgi:hypothetical protein
VEIHIEMDNKLVKDGKITEMCYDPKMTHKDSYTLLYSNSTNCTPKKNIMAAPIFAKFTAFCGTQNPNYSAHKNSHWPRHRAR